MRKHSRFWEVGMNLFGGENGQRRRTQRGGWRSKNLSTACCSQKSPRTPTWCSPPSRTARPCPPPLHRWLATSPRRSFRQAYGIDTLISAGHDGTGQTIAIIDAFNDPNIIADVNAFNTYYGLQRFNVPGGPTLTVLDQNGNAIPDQARTRHERVLSLAV